MDERECRMALSCVVEPATPLVAKAVVEFGALDVWQQLLKSDGAHARKAAKLDLAAVQRRAAAEGIRFVIPGDAEWVERLGDLHRGSPVHDLGGVPIGLWLRGAGELAQLCRRSVSIVGSRSATAYGEHVAADLAADLGEAEVTVISGGAYGIDAAAHRGALSSRTPTVAVLAGGVDSAYPPTHDRLFSQIAARGVLVSEFAPGEHPTRMRFLGRNRVIAALGCGLVMVEASARSGAHNSLTWANSISRPTMAVPGPVTSATSYGPHQAIREAEAVLVTNSAEVREMLGPLGRQLPIPDRERRLTDQLNPVELRVYEAIPARNARSSEEISLRAELAIPQCLGVLNRLADRGLVWQNPRRLWQLTTAKQRESLSA
jgi:DNA processing protein